MALHVALVEDTLKGEGSLRPRVVQADPVDMDTVLDYMGKGMGLEETEMRAVITGLGDALMVYLRDGRRVEMPFGTFHLSARGTYNGDESPRVETRNLQLNFRPSPTLIKTLRASTKVVVDEDAGRRLPRIKGVTNVHTPATVNGGKAGEIIKLQGARLSFDPADKKLGVFLVAEDGTEHRMLIYSRTGTSRVDFQVIDVPAGVYTLEVRTRPTERDVWVGLSPKPFTVKA